MTIEPEYVGLLPALEAPLQRAPIELPPLLQRQRATCAAEDVSLQRLILTGLRSGSAHWFAAAVSWLEQGFPIDEEIARVVHERRQDASLFQQNRQSAFALVRRWEKQRQPAKLQVGFELPEHGWIGVTLESGGATCSARFSHIYPSLEQLCGALCDVASAIPARRAALLLEPDELELSFQISDHEVTLRAELFPDHRRREGMTGEVRFEHAGPIDAVVLPFWRALRHLQTALSPAEFQERWGRPFPDLEMASLTPLVERWKAARSG